MGIRIHFFHQFGGNRFNYFLEFWFWSWLTPLFSKLGPESRLSSRTMFPELGLDSSRSSLNIHGMNGRLNSHTCRQTLPLSPRVSQVVLDSDRSAVPERREESRISSKHRSKLSPIDSKLRVHKALQCRSNLPRCKWRY